MKEVVFSFGNKRDSFFTRIEGKIFFPDRNSISPVPGVSYFVEVTKEFPRYGFVRIIRPVYFNSRVKEGLSYVCFCNEDPRFKITYHKISEKIIRIYPHYSDPRKFSAMIERVYKGQADFPLLDEEKFLKVVETELLLENQVKHIVDQILDKVKSFDDVSSLKQWEIEILISRKEDWLKKELSTWIKTDVIDSVVEHHEQIKKLSSKISQLESDLHVYKAVLEALSEGISIHRSELNLPDEYMDYDFFLVRFSPDGKICKIEGVYMNDLSSFGKIVKEFCSRKDFTHDKVVLESLLHNQKIQKISEVFSEMPVEEVHGKVTSLESEIRTLKQKIKTEEDSLYSSSDWKKFLEMRSHPALQKLFCLYNPDGYLSEPSPAQFKEFITRLLSS